MSGTPASISSSRGAGQGNHFDHVIEPLTREEFLTRYWCKSFFRLPGHPGKFASLFHWDELNSILEAHRLEPPRIRLVKDGKYLDPNTFLAFHQDGAPPSVKAINLMNALAAGATLILNSVDELAPRVRELASDFEDVLRTQTTVNLYAGWRTQRGFNLHWDAQDTMILQLRGRKHWKVFEPTRLHPLENDFEKPPKPTGAPIWDGILEDGDMIYLPRGWWHVAFPLDEASLHLTVTLIPATGVQFLKWFADQLKKHPEARMNLPHLASAEEQRHHLALLRSLFVESWSDDLMDRFLAEMDAHVPVRPHMRLPEGAMPHNAAIGPDSKIRLAFARRLSFGAPNGSQTVSFQANNTNWHCSSELVPALTVLNQNTSRSMHELIACLAEPAAASQLKLFLTALAMGGVVRVEQ